MIEMLGVLAIIGVLSAGGIMGYSIAMENYKVNKTIDMFSEVRGGLLSILTRRHSEAMRIHTDDLCKINVLPSDICKATTGTKNVRKGYFGEELHFQTFTAAAGNTKVNWTLTRTDGSSAILGAPYTNMCIPIRGQLSASACAKLLSSQKWKNFGDLAMIYGLNGLAYVELPLSPTTAETYCKGEVEVSGGGVNFVLYFWVSGARIYPVSS